MANGQPHSVNITRHEKTVMLKVCLCVRVSSMRYGMRTSVLCNTWPLVLFGVVLEVGQTEEMLARTSSSRFLTREAERHRSSSQDSDEVDGDEVS